MWGTETGHGDGGAGVWGEAPGGTSAISLHLPSMDVRRSSGKCLRQGAGPGRDRAACSGGAPSPPRASVETAMPGSKGGGQGLRALEALGPCTPQACPRERPGSGKWAVPPQRLRTGPAWGSQRMSPSQSNTGPLTHSRHRSRGSEAASRASGFAHSRSKNLNPGLGPAASVSRRPPGRHTCTHRHTQIHTHKPWVLIKDLVAEPAIPSPQLPG